ncbi:nuclear RNA export factor 1 [Drosophila bipectinata]|uniref:nuclear RNA export factor 1 n=1 Tax=Drosophila bipectinata TaxID=42026 RepID=UPI001C89ED1A|nr:nuclear RNA export factor 1 [Drosophila bipectinata]
MFSSPRRDTLDGPIFHSTPKERVREISPGPRSPPRIPVSVYGWYRVLVFCKNHRETKGRVMRRLHRLVSPHPLAPRYMHPGGEKDATHDIDAFLTFYVNSYLIASELNRRCMREPKLFLKISDRMPLVRLDDSYRWRLKRTLKARYDPQTRVLDLTQFYTDYAWRNHFCALAQPQCLDAAISIISRFMPDLLCLKLDRNFLRNLRPLAHLDRRLPDLRRISLLNNDIDSLDMLQVFKDLPMTELDIRHNLLSPGYEEDVIRMWPTLRVLNGTSIGLEIRITCDVDPVERLSRQTGMNSIFSHQLLMQNDGDFSKALWVFEELYYANQIPEKAFM